MRKVWNGPGTQTLGTGQPIAQFDLVDGQLGYSRLTVDGVKYWLGTDNGIRHTWTDSMVTNGQQYYYAVTAYDLGSDAFDFYPSENAITAQSCRRRTSRPWRGTWGCTARRTVRASVASRASSCRLWVARSSAFRLGSARAPRSSSRIPRRCTKPGPRVRRRVRPRSPQLFP